MGDRANIVLKQNNQAIYLYTHWSGYELPETLRKGLVKGRSRWDDETYLGRVLFQEMIGTDNGVTGFGIGVYPPDNEYPYLVVDSANQMVMVHDSNLPLRSDGTWTTPVRVLDFEEYVEEERTWENLRAVVA